MEHQTRELAGQLASCVRAVLEAMKAELGDGGHGGAGGDGEDGGDAATIRNGEVACAGALRVAGGLLAGSRPTSAGVKVEDLSSATNAALAIVHGAEPGVPRTQAALRRLLGLLEDTVSVLEKSLPDAAVWAGGARGGGPRASAMAPPTSAWAVPPPPPPVAPSPAARAPLTSPAEEVAASPEGRGRRKPWWTRREPEEPEPADGG